MRMLDRRPERPRWTDNPVADAERYYNYLEECAEYEREAENNYWRNLEEDAQIERDRRG